ncbi:cuticle protein 21 [Anastrepha ludens]|uniref:cuticle protein 21 n=1 Tax=Anastrepha ludens TaxID=28586 RepID=UPI0023B0F138|nr:cuticle protein 21 [Anastrepha ludens]
MRMRILFDFITCIIYIQLSANFLPPSTAQVKQSTLFSEFYADYKNYHNNDELKYAYHYYIDHPESMVHLHHQEERQGTRVIGEYGLLEPGGYVRNVYYMVDSSGGFRAIVRTRTAASSTQQMLQLHQQQPNKPVQHAEPVAFIN